MPRLKTDLRIHEEISTLANKVSDLETQLKEEKKIQAKLKYEVATKDLQLNSLAEETAAENARFKELSKTITQETSDIETVYRSKIRSMEEEKLRLEHEIAAFDIIKGENEYMHQQLKDLTKQFHVDTLSRSSEAEASKQRAFDARMTMELVLRKELQALDANFKQRAVLNLEEEANQARVENTELYAELSRRESLATDLISSQQASYETLQRAIIEHEVMITAAEMYEKHIAEMQEALVREERKLYRIETNLEDATSAVVSLQEAVESKRRNTERLLCAHGEWQSANEKTEKIKKKVLKVARKIVSQIVSGADAVHDLKTKKLAGSDEENPLGVSLDSMSLSTCGSEMLSPSRHNLEIQSRSVNLESFSLDSNYDPETAWKSSHTILPHISGKIRTAVLKKRTKHGN